MVVGQNGLTYDVGDPDLPPQHVVHLGDYYAATVRMPEIDDEEKVWLIIRARLAALNDQLDSTDHERL